jgi:hypothetical protein
MNSVWFNKIEKNEPCWFYNNGGCKNKDGSNKSALECKYNHIYTNDSKKPAYLNVKKPCDKYNLEGDCKWGDNCKYNHRNLPVDEWSRYYPGIPYTLKTNIQKRQLLESKIEDLEKTISSLEIKQDAMTNDLQVLGQTIQQLVRKILIEDKKRW